MGVGATAGAVQKHDNPAGELTGLLQRLARSRQLAGALKWWAKRGNSPRLAVGSHPNHGRPPAPMSDRPSNVDSARGAERAGIDFYIPVELPIRNLDIRLARSRHLPPLPAAGPSASATEPRVRPTPQRSRRVERDTLGRTGADKAPCPTTALAPPAAAMAPGSRGAPLARPDSRATCPYGHPGRVGTRAQPPPAPGPSGRRSGSGSGSVGVGVGRAQGCHSSPGPVSEASPGARPARTPGPPRAVGGSTGSPSVARPR